jgi:hypothetical protein
MYSVAYDTQVSAMHLKSLETRNKDALDSFKDKNLLYNERDKKIIEMLSKIISQNEEIKEKLEKR